MEKGLIVRPLTVSDAANLRVFLRSQSASYARFFSPFAFEDESIAQVLARCEKDLPMGIEWQNRLIGFFMLRGWDEGFDVPSYGVLIEEQFSNYGFASLSLNIAKAVARLRGAPSLMLKVHPDNFAAKELFEKASFKVTGVDAAGGNFIYHFDLPPRATKS